MYSTVGTPYASSCFDEKAEKPAFGILSPTSSALEVSARPAPALSYRRLIMATEAAATFTPRQNIDPEIAKLRF